MGEKYIESLFASWKEFDTVKLIQSGVIIALTISLLIVMRIGYYRFKKRISLTEDIKRQHLFLTIYRILKIFVIVMSILLIFSANGIHLPFVNLCIAALAAIAVFAVKDGFQDFFASFTIMLDKYFSVGDAVEFEGRDGIVVSFTIRTTKIEFLDDHSVMSIANRHITKIRKLTHLVDIDLPLSYELESKRAYSVLTDICSQIRTLDGIEECQLKGIQDFGKSAAVYKIRFFCDPANRPDIRRSVIKTIQLGLEKEGIRIPYTQLDIHSK